MLAMSPDMAALCASIGTPLAHRSGAFDSFTGSESSRQPSDMQIPARVTLAEATAFRAAALAACAAGARDLDLAGLAEYDSAAVAVLLEIRRAPGGAGVRFLNVPANLRKLASLYGVDSLLFDIRTTATDLGRV
jgi:phospholipid transport system transporter-binding protein